MNNEIIEAITLIAKDKKIDKDHLRDMLENIFAQMIIKKYGSDENFDIIGYPRLIRLNPNIPWKTRGNGAISLQVGKGKGSKKIIGVKGEKRFPAIIEIKLIILIF